MLSLRSLLRVPLSVALCALLAGCGEEPAPAPSVASPSLSSFTPAAARGGALLTVMGSSLGKDGKITIGTVAAPHRSWADNRIDFYLPQKLTPGKYPVKVELSGGVALPPQEITVLDPPPQLDEAVPNAAHVGDSIVIKGKNFGKTRGPNDVVLFYGAPATEYAYWRPDEIKFKIPPFETAGEIMVRVGTDISNGIGYRMLKPIVEKVRPIGQLPGQEITLEGYEFTDVKGRVTFGDKQLPGEIVEWADKKIRVIIPKECESGPEVNFKVWSQNGPSFPQAYNVMSEPPDGVCWVTGADAQHAALVLDENGLPTMAWYEPKSKSNAVMRWNGSKWDPLIVRFPMDPKTHKIPNAGFFPSLARGKDGSLHLTFYDYMYEKLHYAYLKPGGTNFELQDPDAQSSQVGNYSSIALRSDGLPVIAYFDRGLGRLKLATGTDKKGIWKVEVVDAAPQTGLSPTLAIDSGDRPHIAYVDMANKDLHYATHDGRAWVTEVVDGEGWKQNHVHKGPAHGPLFPSLKLDAKGVPWIAYLKRRGDLPHTGPADKDGMRLAHRANGKWEVELVEDGADMYCPTLEFDRQGRGHIVSFNEPDATAHYVLYEQGKPVRKKSQTLKNLRVAMELQIGAMALGSDGAPRAMCWAEKKPARLLCYYRLEPPK